MVLNVHINYKAYYGRGKGGREYGRGGRRLYTYRYTITTRMTLALRWTAVRAILMFSLIVRDKDTRQCPQTTISEEKGDPKQI